ncbi:MAG: type 2 isopentenyl-diphosphate Delta-isomerase [Anaerolineae bacterium]|jgi:isopentenyl-diphosphate delta-isomerase|uniref:type 2 isopentenyl-diphosphate Delta-isomerase n=1 Tax=Candidatus Amarolinea dominans TaxID=3140696 RepID=UPI001D53F8E8|nr:type 2 isopentenyl-diphosphate Delta-isomerase [Anaerolineae bacterium]MBK7199827.1 type 2 isopentenyl-diphosphate Delta-isomerase [Anaerolineae bacterium]MBK9093932.1 type 2 isopentenyl-diphosphate Delta-isomerase [Anaerolineae bacterium]MBK9231329.1 type 2 isopentenyl-diphosphate Delta-isomerase [Anaerolineae bacterium]
MQADRGQPHKERKADHIRINLEEDVTFPNLTTGLESYRLRHQALPELDLGAVELQHSLLGKRLSAPLLISSMTGGTARAQEINQRLAEAAQARGLALGVGSQRTALEAPETAVTFQVRHVAPDILLLANLGAVQLNYGYTVDHCRRAVEMIEADALILHLNPLQEALQTDGNWDWSGLLLKIAQVCRELPVPVIAKEVGWGIGGDLARQLCDAGVAAIDVAGAGGTSWSQVELFRAPTERLRRLARAFADWGLPTATALAECRAALPGVPLIASGGIRSGLDVLKCVALGADAVGLAGPFLKAAAVSTEAVLDTIDTLVEEMRIGMFCAGARNLEQLRAPGRLVRVA